MSDGTRNRPGYSDENPIQCYGRCSGTHQPGRILGMRSFLAHGPHWGSNSVRTFPIPICRNSLAMCCSAWVTSLYPSGSIPIPTNPPAAAEAKLLAAKVVLPESVLSKAVKASACTVRTNGLELLERW